MSEIQNNRRRTSTVHVGDIPMGSGYPIRLQSMTNTNTLDTKSTVNQAIRIFDAGADYVRITTQGMKEAQNLENIKNELLKKGYDKPLIADVHFNPKVAELAAAIVEKVRINPGNYTEKKQFSTNELTEKEYWDEVEKCKDKFLRLLEVCKKHSTVIRIGVNHGSLSDRIVNRYGNTPKGMVESAMEFVRICRETDFHQVALSMKASNPKTMVYANRLLVNKMAEENMMYPIHVGVTEAGEGEDGRIKSAVGIGTLLAEGIGDTIRVSLTEEPEREIPVAKILVQSVENVGLPNRKASYIKNDYQRRYTLPVSIIGGTNVPVVIISASSFQKYQDSIHKSKGARPDFFYCENDTEVKNLPQEFNIITTYNIWLHMKASRKFIYPLMSREEYLTGEVHSPELNFVLVTQSGLTQDFITRIKTDNKVVMVLEMQRIKDNDIVLSVIMENRLTNPLLFKGRYSEGDNEQRIIESAVHFGRPFIDGIGDGIWIEINNSRNLDTAFGILQACGARISKTEYISCPTCGRASFNVAKTLKEIKGKTSHLKGLKIAVMGCIVNGPGEMADADYGYVGAGKGKVTLYKGKIKVKKNIPEKDALKELLKIIEEK